MTTGSTKIGGSFPGGGSSASVVFSATKTLTAAQVTTLHSSPVDMGIVPPGAGKKIAPISGFLQWEPGASVFAAGLSIIINYAGDTSSGGFLTTVNPVALDVADVQTMPLDGASSTGLAFDATNKGLVVTAASDPGIFGPITAIAVTAGNAGLTYAPGDLFHITGADGSGAIGKVTTVGAGGAVTGVTISGSGTATGHSYTTTAAATTTVDTGGGDGTLEVDVTVSTVDTGTMSMTVFYGVVDAF